MNRIRCLSVCALALSISAAIADAADKARVAASATRTARPSEDNDRAPLPRRTPELAGPSVGFIASGAMELRAIVGVPGAAVLGEPIPLPEATARMFLAPGQQYALIERGGELAVWMLRDAHSGILPAAPGGADLVVFSPRGTSAALYYGGEERLLIMTGLPSAPRAEREVRIGGLRAAAVSDDGAEVLAASDTGVVFERGGAAPVPLLDTAGGGVALAFLPRRAGAVAYDSRTAEVWWIETGGSGSVRRLAALDPADGPAFVRASADGTEVLVAARGARQLWSIDVTTGAVRLHELPAAVLSLAALKLPDTFLLAAEPGKPAWVFVRQGAEARTVFVPAAETGAQEER